MSAHTDSNCSNYAHKLFQLESDYRLQEIDASEKKELINTLRKELSRAKAFNFQLHTQISSQENIIRDYETREARLSAECNQKIAEYQKKIISLQGVLSPKSKKNSPTKSSSFGRSSDSSHNMSTIFATKKLNSTIREQAKLLSIYETNIATMLEKNEELSADIASMTTEVSFLRMSLEDIAATSVRIREHLEKEKTYSKNLLDEIEVLKIAHGAKIKDANLRVFNAISEKNHWKKKVNFLYYYSN